MDNNTTKTIILVVCILIIILFQFGLFKIKIHFEEPINKSLTYSELETTYFLIYDKSVGEECDRLILVKPFPWMIWAVNGNVYLLNTSNYECPANKTPAVITPSKITVNTEDITNGMNDNGYVFVNTCMSIQTGNIMEKYEDVAPVKVLYDIEELASVKDKFTQLDALNYLFTKYITMRDDDQDNTNIETFKGGHGLINKYMSSTKNKELNAIVTKRRSGLSMKNQRKLDHLISKHRMNMVFNDRPQPKNNNNV
jgi:hypothetical protein